MITYKRFLLDMAGERTADIDRIAQIIGDIYGSLALNDDRILKDIYTRQLNAYIDQIEHYGKTKAIYHKLLDELDEDVLEQEFNMKLHKYHYELKGE